MAAQAALAQRDWAATPYQKRAAMLRRAGFRSLVTGAGPRSSGVAFGATPLEVITAAMFAVAAGREVRRCSTQRRQGPATGQVVQAIGAVLVAAGASTR